MPHPIGFGVLFCITTTPYTHLLLFPRTGFLSISVPQTLWLSDEPMHLFSEQCF